MFGIKSKATSGAATGTALSAANGLADPSAVAAHQAAIDSARRAVNQALDSLADASHGGHGEAAALLQRAGAQLGALAHQGGDALRDHARQVRERARQAGADSVGYIRHAPVKSTLIAAASGAALVLMLRLMNRMRARR